jgi:methylglutaconyl-CoA hydratase
MWKSRPMSNPIADPLVENVVAEDIADLVRIDASPEGVAVVTINRPHRANAFDGQTILALREAFETLHGADHVRIVFVRGEGETFCAGLDLDWMQVAADWTEADNRDDAQAVAAMFRALADIPAVTVALVEGQAFGSGAGLVAACDAAVAEAGARFAFPEVTQGEIPAMYSAYVTAAVGPRQAAVLFATGREIAAEEALRIGLVQEVVQGADGLMAAQERWAEAAMAAAPGAMRDAKALPWHVAGRRIDRELTDDLARRLAAARVGDEGREGVRAVIEGRPPSWRAS